MYSKSFLYFQRVVSILVSVAWLVTGTISLHAESAESLQHYLDQAAQAYYKGDLDAAIDHYHKAIKIAPNAPAAYGGLGFIYAQQENFTDAITAYQRVIALDVDRIYAYVELAIAYRKTKQLAQAIRHYEAALKRDANLTRAHIGLGLIYTDLGRLDEAENAYKRALDIDPNLAEGYHNLGFVYSRQGRYDKAISLFQQAIRLKPELAWAHYELGLAYTKQGQWDTALDAFRKTIALDADHISAYYNLAQVYIHQGNVQAGEAALATFKKLSNAEEKVQWRKRYVERNPNSPQAYLELAAAYVQRSNLSKAKSRESSLHNALQAYTQAIKLDPNYVEAYLGRGDVYTELGNDSLVIRRQEDKSMIYNELAIADYRRVLMLNPSVAKVHINLGQVFLRQGKIEEAQTHYEKASQSNPNLAQAHAVLGAIYSNRGELARAIQSYQRAIELEPDRAEVLNNLAWLYAENEIHLDEALELAEKAVSIYPHPVHFDTLAWVYYKRREYALAEATIRKALRINPANEGYLSHLKAIQASLHQKKETEK